MTRLILALCLSLAAAPALAGRLTFGMPNLTFPEPVPPATSQDCARPSASGAPSCWRS